MKAALDVFSDPCGPDDDRGAPARRVDGLLEMAERAMDPRSVGHGHVTITLTPEEAESKLGVTWPSGSLASRTDLALHACSAEVSYVVGHKTDVAWQPLAVGFAATVRHTRPTPRPDRPGRQHLRPPRLHRPGLADRGPPHHPVG
ncbi:MAG: hypothetical protein V9G10_14745 [Candidatus Nanopelagicales bacterium]